MTSGRYVCTNCGLICHITGFVMLSDQQVLSFKCGPCSLPPDDSEKPRFEVVVDRAIGIVVVTDTYQTLVCTNEKFADWVCLALNNQRFEGNLIP